MAESQGGKQDADSGTGTFLIVSRTIGIPLDEFSFTFMRSSGPGGQNVNKVNTKVRLRWPIIASETLRDDVKQRFLAKYRRRITSEGDFVISSQRYRDQRRNIDDCLNKLRDLLADVATAPTRRKKTKPSRSSVRRRLADKRRHSEKKQRRRGTDMDG